MDAVKNGRPLVAALLSAALYIAPAAAEQIAEIETRSGVTVRVAVQEPSAPIGGAILLAGGEGRLKLGKGLNFLNRTGNFAIRVRHRFRRAGYIVVSMDVPSDRRDLHGFRASSSHAADIGGVIAWLRKKTAGPVWLIGHSRGSISAANGGARLGSAPTGPDGVVLLSSVTETSNDGKPTIYDVPLDALRQPAIVVHHRDDECYVTPLHGALALARRLGTQVIRIEGGKPPVSRPCQAKSPHGFFGKEPETIAQVTAAMKAAAAN